MKPFRIALVLMCFTAFPALAADHVFDLTGWAAWIDPNSNGTFNASFPNQPFDVRFDGKMGYGIGANIFFGNHFSAAFDVAQVRPGTTLRTRAVGGTSFTTTGTRMTPITGILQWHFAPGGGIDPYIGAGAAYVVFDKTNVFKSATLSQINIKDDAGLALNAGVSFRLSRMLALTADGKYVPLKAGATPVYAPGTTPIVPITLNAKINPVIFSGGLTLRF
ncbi:MAG TPA: OmpW family outer membrane protein [Thermoanaerobaculia bacterium]|nr:OmpW family outer membrane protein [Thermoanaerobaculia bacterium]